MARWITVGSRAFNIDAIVAAERQRNGKLVFFASSGASGSKPLELNDAEYQAVFDALFAAGLKMPDKPLGIDERR